jgi:hypothetical protein
MTSQEFYEKYSKGYFGDESDNSDFMIWSEEYECYQDFIKELNKLVS